MLCVRKVIRLLFSLFSCDSVIFQCLPNTQCKALTREITNSSFTVHIIVWYFELACLLVRLAPFRRKDTKCRKSQIVFTRKHPKRLRSCSKHTRANVAAFYSYETMCFSLQYVDIVQTLCSVLYRTCYFIFFSTNNEYCSNLRRLLIYYHISTIKHSKNIFFILRWIEKT